MRDDSDGEGLINATVRVEVAQLGTTTSPSGYYVLPRVPTGEHRLIFTYIGYLRLEQEITVGVDVDTRVDVRLQTEALQAAETIVRADSMRTSERLYRKPISEIQLSARQINAIPQVAEADLLRSLQSLPGVLPLSDFSSALYVRGGTPDQNLYLIDGTDVYNPEHTFGIFSTFNTDAIKQAQLSKGGFGAEYGGRLSSVLDVTNLDGNREEFEGTAAISLLSAKTTLQTPLGKSGSLSGSIRRTYFDQTVGRTLKDIPDYYFYDGNLKAFFELSDRDQLTGSFYGGRDFLDVIFNGDSTEETGIEYDWGNKTGSLRWMRVFTPRLFGNFWFTSSRFTSDIALPIADITERNLITDVTAKGNVEYHHSDALASSFGFERKDLRVKYRQKFPAGLIDIANEPIHYVLYGQSTWRPSILWELETGLRYNLFDNDRVFHNLGPRFSVKHRLTDTINLRAASGVYFQYLHRIPRFIVTDIWVASNQFQKESRSIHAILGYQHELARNFQLEVEGYWKGYDNIYQFNQTFLTVLQATSYADDDSPVWSSSEGLFNQGEGHSIGLEAMLRKDSGAVTGWLAYSIGRTEYTFEDINSDRDFTPRHDRSHVANLVVNIDVRNGLRKLRGERKRRDPGKWTLGITTIYGSGQPITDPGSVYVTRVAPSQEGSMLNHAPTVINGLRIPAYARLDVSLSYSRDFASWSMAPYVQLFNAGNRKNIWFVDYDFRGLETDIDPVHMFPILPTFGATFTF